MVDGKCLENYSFKSEYYVDQKNKTIDLIYKTYKDKILELIIDGNRINEINTN